MSDIKFPEGITPISQDSDFAKMAEKLKGMDFSNITVPQFDLSYASRQIDEINASMQAANEERWKREEAEETFWEESLKMLKGIEQNTANLYMLVDLISKGNEQQDELIAIIAEVLTIAKAKSQAEAKSAYTKVMGRITQTIKDAETLAKIAGYATTVWTLAQPIIENLPQIGG